MGRCWPVQIIAMEWKFGIQASGVSCGHCQIPMSIPWHGALTVSVLELSRVMALLSCGKEPPDRRSGRSPAIATTRAKDGFWQMDDLSPNVSLPYIPVLNCG